MEYGYERFLENARKGDTPRNPTSEVGVKLYLGFFRSSLFIFFVSSGMFGDSQK